MMGEQKMRKFTAIIVVLMTFATILDAQEPKCVGGRELIVCKFDSKTFDQAEQACRDLGGSLLKVDNVEITNRINSEIRAGEKHYYIGARSERGRWKWRDGTEIGYHNWLPGEPNRDNEHCVGVNIDEQGNKGWLDISCSSVVYYLCQKDKLTLTVTTKSITLSSPGTHTVTCQEKASCSSSTVSWYRGSSPVTQSRTSSVYQTIGSKSSNLVLRSAKIGDSGTYKCQATASGNRNVQGDLFVNVLGSPTISSAGSVACTSNIQVSWTPHSLALGYLHKMKAYSDPNHPRILQTTPQSRSRISTFFTNLLPSTKYTIQIVACKSSSVCTNTYVATRNTRITTGGVPNFVRNAKFQNDDGVCHLSWQEPTVKGDPITGYAISLTTKFNSTRAANKTAEILVFKTTGTSHSFMSLPNRNYSATIRSVACGGESVPVHPSGKCFGPLQAPVGLKSPAVSIRSKELLGNVTVEVPDEINGTMSCLFVIISNRTLMGDETVDQTEYTFDKLLMTNSSESPKNSSTNGGYVAVAIPASSFAFEAKVIATIGDNTHSSCNLYETRHEITVNGSDSSITMQRSARILAQNKPFSIGGLYRVFVVAAVPNGENILLSESPYTNFSMHQFETTTTANNQNPSDTSSDSTTGGSADPFDASSSTPRLGGSAGNVGATVGSICGVVILLLLSIVFFYLYKKRRDAKNWNSMKASLQNVQPTVRGGLENLNLEREEDEDGGRVQVSVNLGGSGEPRANYATVLHNEASFRISHIDQVYSTKRSRNNAGFSEEFQKIVLNSAQFEGTKKIASSDHLKSKNRYRNILPFDANRVILETGDFDYINASYIRGCEQKNKYIATQGPLAKTVNDFWRMVLEHNSSTIVMLTKGCEAGKKKCESYWPGSRMHQTYGCVTVQNIQEINYGAYICRTLGISLATGCAKVETRFVHHYQFLKWPDHGVPQTTSNLVRMHRAIAHDYAESQSSGPMIVHCSAGAGRSGTFIGYDILLDEMRKKSRIDVFKCVMEMRKQRVDMVQNFEQYVLLHKLLLESYLFDDTDCSAEEVKDKFNEMSSPGWNGVVLNEFENLAKVEPMKNAKISGMMDENKAFSLHGNEIPYDYSRVTIMMREDETGVPYLNASWVESYDETCPMIAAQGPTDASIAIFWRAVVSNGVRAIVMLTNLDENHKKQCVQYWPSEPGEELVFGDISVTLIGHELHGTVVQRSLKVNQASRRRSFQVTQLHYIDWQQESNPGSYNDVINLAVRMQEVLRQTAKAAALIHCSDGIGRTGTFCAIVNLLDRLKCENKIDVFRTVKDLRDGRPCMVKTLDQYKYCYQAVVHYLKSFELYSNF